MTDEQTTEKPEDNENSPEHRIARMVAECPKHGVLSDYAAIPTLQIHGVPVDMPCPKCLNAALKKLGVHRVRYKAL